MSRHNLIVSYGKKETVIVQRGGITDQFIINPNSTLQKYGFNSTLLDLANLGLKVQEIAIDMFLIAMSVYAADTRINRKSNAEDQWTRKIDLYLPVSDTILWDKNKQLLSNLLQFLTGDCWSFIFRSRPKEYQSLASSAKPNLFTKITNVTLLSGGLDSFIGAIDLLTSQQNPLFISHYNDPITSSTQTYCINALSESFGNDSFEHLKAHIGFPKILFNGYEDTTRSRSFLFYTLAILASSALHGKTDIIVPENGLIALNVPLDTLRLGALSTRTAHPYFIARLNQLISELGIEANIYNPYRHQTKGEMILHCKNKEFLQLHIAKTMSCSDPKKERWLGKTPKHCGYCLPCLIRRASIKHGMSTDYTPYGLPLDNTIIDSKTAKGIQIRSFQLAFEKLQANPSLAKVLIHKPGSLQDASDEIPLYENLYYQGMKEVYELVKDIPIKPLS